MRALTLLAAVSVILLSGCATFDQSEVKSKVDRLDSRVALIEERQEEIEDRLDDTGVSESTVTYVTNVEPKRDTSTAASPRGDVSLSKKEIQTALKNAGYYEGAIDGKIGRMSKKAIREFQSDHGLKVDGIVGPRTRAALRPYLDGPVK